MAAASLLKKNKKLGIISHGIYNGVDFILPRTF